MSCSGIRNHPTRRGAAAVVASLLIAGLLAPVASTGATGQEEESAAGGWGFGASAHLDLWFHGLAVLGLQGSGALPLYDPGYAAAIRQAKGARARFPTRLDAQAQRFVEAFAGDSVFELLHFMPLYFVSADRELMFDALRAIDRDGGAGGVTNQRTKFGASAIAGLIQKPDQRRLLAEYADLLEEEWGVFYEGFRAQLMTRRNSQHEELQSRWDADLGPKLASYLESVHLDRGLILVSPALGPEGRIFEGNPRDRDDNLVVVGFPLGSDDIEATLAFVVRELSFPILRQVVNQARGAGRNPEDLVRASSIAAVRCGALLLRRHAPASVAAYQRAFLRARGLEPAAAPRLDEHFRELYAISAELEDELAAEVDR